MNVVIILLLYLKKYFLQKKYRFSLYLLKSVQIFCANIVTKIFHFFPIFFKQNIYTCRTGINSKKLILFSSDGQGRGQSSDHINTNNNCSPKLKSLKNYFIRSATKILTKLHLAVNKVFFLK